MHMVAALEASPEVRPVLGLHETVCSGAADGYARVSGRPAMALLHLGPGFSNSMANLHNARRARSPVLVVVGDMSSWIRPFDPVLNSDIPAMAGTVGSVVEARVPEGLTREDRGPEARARMLSAGLAALSEAFERTRPDASNPQGSRVSTLIMDHDMAYCERPEGGDEVPVLRGPKLDAPLPAVADEAGVSSFADDLASMLLRAREDKTPVAVLVGGFAIGDDEVYTALGRVASVTGATLLSETFPSISSRGAGLPNPQRVPYFPQDALAEVRKYKRFVLVDARRPVAMFGYEDGPAEIIGLPDEDVWEVDGPPQDVRLFALRLEAAVARADAPTSGAVRLDVRPGVNCRGVFSPAAVRRPTLPKPEARLTADALMRVVASQQPEGAIVVDEAITSGFAYVPASANCPPFRQMQLTGGAIGSGIPLALGAALAEPTKQIICLQADGSGLYSAQGLWTMARERTRVLVVVCANNIYSILKVELAKQHCEIERSKQVKPQDGASRRLTEISSPAIDWVALANGFGVPAKRATTVGEAQEAVREGLATDGPFLVHALI